MIGDLKPYAEYKESGLPWIGQVPRHWGSRRLKFLFKERSQNGLPHEPLLAATQSKGVVRKEDYGLRTVTAMNGLENLKLVEVGDFVISLRSFQGGIEVSHARGIISPAYTVLEPRSGFEPRYFKAYFKSFDFISSLTLFVTGIREGQNIDYERLRRALMPLPPPHEQAAIVRFLDWANGRLDRTIRAKRKVIALLNEQKQAIIHRAVTRGLDTSVPLKPSESRWFPELPAGWETLTLRRVITSAIDGPHFSPRYQDSGIPFLSARNVRSDRWILSDAKFISEADYTEFSRRVRPEVGDVLYTKGGTTGVARAVDLTFPFQVWVHIAVLKLKRHRMAPAFLAYGLNSPRCYEQAQLFTRGATNQDLGLGRMKDIELPVPPTLDEQNAIVDSLDCQCSAFTSAITRLEREIELLREYRTRLVADVVTGKLDVRHAAARVPDDAAPDTAADEPNLGHEADAVAEGVA